MPGRPSRSTLRVSIQPSTAMNRKLPWSSSLSARNALARALFLAGEVLNQQSSPIFDKRSFPCQERVSPNARRSVQASRKRSPLTRFSVSSST